MRWPWSRAPERRAAGGYTDLILSAFETAAGAQSNVGQTAALEAAVGSISRGFASAIVKDAPDHVVAALTPHVLADIGRDMIRSGESLHVIEVENGELKLYRCGQWDIRGSWQPSTWTVRATVFGPSETLSRVVPYASVVHCKFASDKSRPWAGLGPTSWAGLSAKLAAGATAKLVEEMGALTATVIPAPPGETPDDADDDPLKGLKASLVRAKGRSVFVESMRSSFGGDHRDSPLGDWQQKRLGPAPNEALAELNDKAALQVLAACGVDPLMTGLSRGDGTALREAYRRYERLTLAPLARIVTTELRDKLDAPALQLSLAALRASDFAGVARALKAMIEAGVSPEAAAAILDVEI